MSYSAITRYIIREHGQESIFKQIPALGEAMNQRDSKSTIEQLHFPVIHQSVSKHPLLHDVLILCLLGLVNKLTPIQISEECFLVYGPERSVNILRGWSY